MANRKKLKSDIVLVETDKITMHGLDLCRDILGKVNLGDMAFLQLKGRLPTPQESVVFNAIAVTLVEHGMTPSAIAARMTYAGSPEAMSAVCDGPDATRDDADASITAGLKSAENC